MAKKNILILITLLVAACGVYIKSRLDKKDSQKNKSIRVATHKVYKYDYYDPARINFLSEYFILENIYSTLVDYDLEKGVPLPGIARSFTWLDNKLHLEFRDDLITVNGYKISAKDAEISLKRLIILNKNTHGNLKAILCPDQEMNSIEDRCSGIEVNENKLILTPHEGAHFLLPMLGAVDFSIIPIDSIDKKTLKIKEKRNTSGPYYIQEVTEGKSVVLRANPNHYKYSSEMPQEIIIEQLSRGKAYEGLLSGEIDLIPISMYLEEDDMLKLEHNQSIRISKTHAFSMNLAIFTPVGVSEFTEEERFEIGRNIKRAWSRHNGSSIHEDAEQFLPEIAEGALGKSELQKITRKRDGKHKEIDRSVRVGFVSKSLWSQGLENELRSQDVKIDVLRSVESPYLSSLEVPDNEYHVKIFNTDAGFLEDIGLLSYSIKAGVFGSNLEKLEAWLETYISTPNKESRMELLRKLHFRALDSGHIFPLSKQSYYSYTVKKWETNFPKLFANNPIWKMRKSE